MDILKEWRIATGSIFAVLFVDLYLEKLLSGGAGPVYVYLIAATSLLLLLSDKRNRKKIATGKLNSSHIYFWYSIAALWSVLCIYHGTRELTAERISVLPIPAAVFIFATGRIIWLLLSVKRSAGAKGPGTDS